ncbi:hypothetical protein [Candidatus Nitrotoga sp. AM1P]|uniref:hypothetical protein n=1 Tax=Candidatus Nitrotoga sp. AM1P TaxID=2559597 RepID=UPI0010B3993F|nr:hypothetical protein [Candidatus Nitrotoga sp. AM1P]BBJ22376.1 hypothetical protein W01_03030 [Candidatus Nitrotoga sp. AM1P]
MQELLDHPAVQGGLAPFVIALIVAELLQRLRLSGLAIIAGFAITVYLVSGFSFEPLTSARKIVLLGLLSALLALTLLQFNWRPLRLILTIAGGIATVWMALRILQQQDMTHMLLWSGGCALYVGWLIFWMDTLHESPVRAGSAGMALGLGTGGSALLGASALLGQFGLALGAAASAYLLLQAISNSRLPCGRSFTLPLSLIAGLTGCLAVLTAQLPWYALTVLAGIPLAAKIPVSEKMGLWLQSLLLSIATLACAAGATYITWYVAGAPPF